MVGNFFCLKSFKWCFSCIFYFSLIEANKNWWYTSQLHLVTTLFLSLNFLQNNIGIIVQKKWDFLVKYCLSKEDIKLDFLKFWICVFKSYSSLLLNFFNFVYNPQLPEQKTQKQIVTNLNGQKLSFYVNHMRWQRVNFRYTFPNFKRYSIGIGL